MKKNYILFFGLVIVPLIVLCSCASMLFGEIGQKIHKDMPKDFSDSAYCDYKIENFKLPDGKIADVYVFENIRDQAVWLNLQKFATIEDGAAIGDRFVGRKYYEKQIAYYKSRKDSKMAADYEWRLNIKGPMTPFYSQYTKMLAQYGGQKQLLKLAEEQKELFVVSYYKAEELGELGACLTGTGYASACYEDSKGVYWLRFSTPEDLVALRGKKEEQKRHVGEIGYEVVFIPREMYPKITPPKLKPAKITPYNPSSIPDSDRDLTPVAPTGNAEYYYDETLTAQLQWLAVKIACKGIYDMAYRGDFSAKNPTDYYKTSFIKKYLASNEGKASKGTDLFEGICFDYADFSYRELRDHRNEYSSRIAKFWMVGTFEDANDIITYRIAQNGEKSNDTINGTPVVIFNHNHILAHKNAQNHAAQNHAWFWIQSTDGTMYWVDPTWTDNSGHPVYGIVRGGKEIQLPYYPNLCAR